MEWRDTGIVLGARRLGESGVVVSLLTAGHGRHAGLVRGGGGTRGGALFQPGNVVAATWKGRTEDQLGAWACELLEPVAAGVMADAGRLAALASVCTLIESGLPDRAPHPDLHDATLAFLAAIHQAEWAESYIRWESFFLAELGFGLDLESCAATGGTDNLIWVSPRSGRAVSAAAGEPYRDKLLPLPAFLRPGSGEPADADALRAGLRLTGYFLERHVFAPHHRPLPAARDRLVEWLVDRAPAPRP